MLTIRGLETGYGKVRILRGVDLTVADGAIVALLGGNGTGKSTLLKCVSGLLPAWSGSVEFDGQPISGLAPDRIVRLGLVQVTQSKDCVPAMTVEENLRLGAYTRRDRAGIARTFQLLRMFSEMTVLENLMVGHHVHGSYGALAAGLGLGRVRAEGRAGARGDDGAAVHHRARGLRGAARRGSVDRAAPAAGARARDGDAPEAPAARRAGGGAEPGQRRQPDADRGGAQGPSRADGGHIEHILRVVMEVCDRVTVLDHGQKIGEGTPDEVKEDPAVVEAYLGRQLDDAEVRAAIGSRAARRRRRDRSDAMRTEGTG